MITNIELHKMPTSTLVIYQHNAFVDWLKREMKRKKITQDTMSRLCGKSHQVFSGRMTGKTDFTLDELLIIFKRLETEPETIAYWLTLKE